MSPIEYGLNYIKQHKILTSRKEREAFIIEFDGNIDELIAKGTIDGNLMVK